MEPIQFAYSKVPNMGDLLNEYIMRDIFHRNFVHTESVIRYEITGIGSFMDTLFTGPSKESKGVKKIVKNIIFSHCHNTCFTWGTGFLDDYSADRTGLVRNKVEFVAVRGRLTQNSIEKILHTSIQPTLGDGGILAPYLFEREIPVTCEVGIIPHFREQNAEELEMLKTKYPKARIINLKKEPLEVIKDIAECQFILSSSLHGLVIADAFRRPNMRIYMTDAPLGSGFKFDDYYSAYGLIQPARRVVMGNIPSIQDIIDQYKVTDTMVSDMKKGMLNSMEYILSKEQ